MGKMIGAAQFKAHCLRIMEEAKRSGETVVITKRGKPFMELKPVAPDEPTPLFGCMKTSGYSFPDPVSPAYDGPWDAEKEGPWEPGA
jgi:antitoxin (DNA-binding transcriptional repressor) of toxin-antitoxin stability system